MAIDNLNFYSTWLPAWQQTDRYSSQPWCLRSKNLDIFSSSKSVKATAWSNPTTTGSDIIKQDWDLILKTDWKVYQLVDGTPTLFVDPSTNFPVYKVSYEWSWATYSNAQWGTVKDMVVKYEWDEWRSFVVFTDKSSYTYSKAPYIAEKALDKSSDLTALDWPTVYGYPYEKNSTTSSSSTITVKMPNVNFATVPIKVYAEQNVSSNTNITLDSITWYKKKYYYDPQQDGMVSALDELTTLPLPEWDIKTAPVLIQIPASPYDWESQIRLNFKYTKVDPSNNYWWTGTLYVDMNLPTEWHRISWYENWDYNEYYSYLSVDENRHLEEVWEYYWMPWLSFQTLYTWQDTRTKVANSKKVERYDFVAYMWWESDVSMDVIWMIVWNEAVYMVGNMNWNWYIIPCDLSWGRWTPYIAYGCEFKGVTNIDYLMYLVWDDRWVSQLWAYNWQELVAILWWSEEKDTKNLVDTAEQYKFDWKMVNYRKDLILSTSDNRIFAYWQTYWGKWGVFIHQLPWTITKIVSKDKDLVVEYEVSSTKYTTTLQDDTPIKYYNTEWMAEYPIVLGNHLLEKEESDLYASYILPNSSCKLEFWGMANHYHFRTFKSSDNYTFDSTKSYKMKWCTGTYSLKYIEKNGDEYTFRLEGDLPVQTTNDMKITDTEWTELITYTEYNHFRKIGEITTAGYQEWEFRFHNLNNKLELPRSYSLQIMVKGKGTTNYTPELFAVDLVANQRDRW